MHENMDPHTRHLFNHAVLGVVFEVNNRSNFADRFFDKLFGFEDVDTMADFLDHVDLTQRYVYDGSLTTPPYTQRLIWNMVKNRVVVD